MKKMLMTAMLFAASVGLNAQTAQKQVVEEGGPKATSLSI